MKKTVLITGAAKRIGKAMAFHLAGKGWDVALHYYSSDDEANSVKEELCKKYPAQRFELFKLNLEEVHKVGNLVSLVQQKMNGIDMLINSASVFEASALVNTSAELFERQLKINLTAPFVLSTMFAKTCKNGLIVNFTDTRIVSNQSSHAAYSISKKALWELTKMAALEFGPNIRVNSIAPGLTLPPEGNGQEYLNKLSEKIAMKRPGGVEPILRSLDFIIDNEYLTGQLLFCDGGENLGLTK